MRKLAIFSFSFAASCLLYSLYSGKAVFFYLIAADFLTAVAAFLLKNKKTWIVFYGLSFGIIWFFGYDAFFAGAAENIGEWVTGILPEPGVLTGAAEQLFDKQSASFIKALLTGDRTDFFQDAALSTAFRRSGISHLVAVSGMHVSFLVSTVQAVTGKTKRSAYVCSPCVWLFVLLSGASASALRAAVMQSVLLFAPIVKRENDTVTSLSFALLLLLAADPSSILTASLQLSFAAVLGISLFSEHLEKQVLKCFGKFSDRKVIKYLAGTMTSSVAVMVFTVPLTALHFGSVQLLSPITNILVLWCVSFCFVGGMICIAASFLWMPAAAVLAKPIGAAVRYIIHCARAVSAWKLSTVYVCSDYAVYWVIGVYAVFFLFSRIGPIGKRMRPLLRGVIPLVISVASLCLLQNVTAQYYVSQPGFFTAVSVGQGQSISVISGEATVMVDCGSTFTSENAGEKAGEYLLSRGRDRIDVLVLTHLHEDHANGVPVLLEYLPVEKILISAYVPDDDDLLPELMAEAEAHGSEVILVNRSAQVECGNILLDLYTPQTGGSDNETCIFVQATVDGRNLLITGDAPAAAEKEYIKTHGVSGIDVLIAGHHGSKTSTCDDLIAHCLDAGCIVSTGKNPYGHPAPETMERLSVLPAVYRTDQDGTVQIAVGNICE